MIQTRDLSFSYSKGRNTLHNLSFDIAANALVAVIGLNGAGKSTLFGCLTKQLAVERGRIFINGKDICACRYQKLAKLISLVPQVSSVWQTDSTVRDYMVEGRTPYLPLFAVPGPKEYRIVEQVADNIGITPLLEAPFSRLSGGQQQLCLIARALVQDTPIIILDEPMSALDLKNQALVLKQIQAMLQNGKTVIFSTHDPNHAFLLGADLLLLDKGKIISYGKATETLLDDNVSRIFEDYVKLADFQGQKRLLLTI